MREAGSFSLATISRCERTGSYPATRATRLLYLSVLGLPTDNLDAPVAPRAKVGTAGQSLGKGNYKS